MKRFASLTMAALLFTALPAAGQSIYFGVGPTFPSSDYSEYAKTGFLVAGGVTYEVASQLSIYGEGFWGQNNHEGSGKTAPSGLMAGLMYGFGGEDAPISPYVFGGGGLLTHRWIPDEGDSESNSGFGFQGGAGIGFDIAGLQAFAEGRYTSGSIDEEISPGVTASATTAFIGILLGLSFNFGG